MISVPQQDEKPSVFTGERRQDAARPWDCPECGQPAPIDPSDPLHAVGCKRMKRIWMDE